MAGRQGCKQQTKQQELEAETSNLHAQSVKQKANWNWGQVINTPVTYFFFQQCCTTFSNTTTSKEPIIQISDDFYLIHYFTTFFHQNRFSSSYVTFGDDDIYHFRTYFMQQEIITRVIYGELQTH